MGCSPTLLLWWLGEGGGDLSVVTAFVVAHVILGCCADVEGCTRLNVGAEAECGGFYDWCGSA